MTAAYQKQAGFTLVEVLISLFIFALISAGTMGAMFQTFAAKDRLDRASAELADMAAFRAILRADMGAMDLRPMRDGVGGLENYLVTTQNSEQSDAILTFTRLGRSNPSGAARGQAERVRYIFRDGQFVRESLLHENPAQREDWVGRVLLDGLENVEIIRRYSSLSAGASTPNFTSGDWIIPYQSSNNSAFQDDVETSEQNAFNYGSMGGAVEFKITSQGGIETSHFFEIGL